MEMPRRGRAQFGMERQAAASKPDSRIQSDVAEFLQGQELRRRVDQPIGRSEVRRRKRFRIRSHSARGRSASTPPAPCASRSIESPTSSGRRREHAGARATDAAGPPDPACAGTVRRRRRRRRPKKPGEIEPVEDSPRRRRAACWSARASAARVPSISSTSGMPGYGRVCLSRRVVVDREEAFERIGQARSMPARLERARDERGGAVADHAADRALRAAAPLRTTRAARSPTSAMSRRESIKRAVEIEDDQRERTWSRLGGSRASR